MSLEFCVQRAVQTAPPDSDLKNYVLAALPVDRRAGELCIRIVDEQEGALLNSQYRNKSGPTNVLSFPYDAGIEGMDLLGDLVICAPVVAAEARVQGKPESEHWAHMVVHGVLHLLGYDHIDDHDAVVMEAKERAILAGLGISDPYLPENNIEVTRQR